jgi:hypothetical protein
MSIEKAAMMSCNDAQVSTLDFSSEGATLEVHPSPLSEQEITHRLFAARSTLFAKVVASEAGFKSQVFNLLPE